MGLKSKWRGSLKIGLVNVPMRLFKSTDPKASISFNQLHTCKSRIKQKTWCPICDIEVAPADKLRGYEHAKGQYVVITDADLEQFELDSTKTIEISQIVNASELSSLYIDETDYAAPDGPGALGAFVVIRDSLKGKAAIGTVVTRGREDIVAVMPLGDGMVVHHLRYESELRGLDEIDELQGLPKANDIEMKLAAQLFALYQQPLDLSQFTDRFNDGVKSVIAAKAAGTAPPTPTAKVVAPNQPTDLMGALRASIASPPPLPKSKPGPNVKATKPIKAKLPPAAKRKKA